MRTPSNLPPGCTDADIERACGGDEDRPDNDWPENPLTHAEQYPPEQSMTEPKRYNKDIIHHASGWPELVMSVQPRGKWVTFEDFDRLSQAHARLKMFLSGAEAQLAEHTALLEWAQENGVDLTRWSGTYRAFAKGDVFGENGPTILAAIKNLKDKCNP